MPGTFDVEKTLIDSESSEIVVLPQRDSQFRVTKNTALYSTDVE
jgi:hypothetical protein